YIAQQMYPGVDRKDLTEEQRQTISALGTLAAGLAGGVVGDSTADAVAGAQAGKTSLENNNLILPAPVPVPGVPVGPGDQVKQDADKQIASGLDGSLKDFGEAIDKATQCSFGRACSEDTGESSANQPNIGKDLTDAEKAELSGSGSGTPGGWEPQDEENARNNENKQNNNFDRFKKDDLVSSANEPINEQGLSAAARAWEKHAGRPGGVFEPLKGNPAQKSEAANQFVNEVLNNKNTVKTDLSRGGVEYRLPDGRGVRYNSDGSFSGFLDPKMPR
ncbi:VENN motif pre-toxin domain-containing protein, partial [Erwinia billingiae]